MSQDIEGTGTVGISAKSIGGSGYVTQFVGLRFDPPSPSPTPEPASLVLLGTGIAAAWRSRRLRHLR